MAWRVGMKCECVRSGPSYIADGVLKGSIYTVRDAYGDFFGNTGLLLEGITTGEFFPDGRERGYIASAFRPLAEKKTDIGFAHEILRTVTKPVPVDAETMRAFDRAMAEAYPGYVPDYVGKHKP
jgi:hypothetical protein